MVTLGFDTKDFIKGDQKVKNTLKDTKKQAQDTGKGFDSLAASAAKFLAVIGGSYAIKSFIEQTILSSAALDRLSKNLGASTETLSSWSNAAEIAGGSAEGLQGTMDMLSKSQTELMLTGQSHLIPYFSALGVSIADIGGKARPVDDILLDLADRFQGLDRPTANNMGRMMGLDQGTLNLLLQGRQEVELMISKQKQYNVITKQQGEESTKLRAKVIEVKQTFESFGRSLVSAALPILQKVADVFMRFGEWVHENSEFVKTFLAIMATGIAAIVAAAIPINLTVAAITALGAAIALFYNDYATWKRGGESFIDWSKWEPGIKAAGDGIKWLRDQIRSLIDSILEMTDGLSKLPSSKGSPTFRQFINGMTFGLTGNDTGQSATGSGGGSNKSYSGKSSGATGGNTDADAMIKYFMKQGYTKDQAAGIAASAKRESNFNAHQKQIGGGPGYGLFQLEGPRQKDFKEVMGKDIRDSSAEEQMSFMQWELNNRPWAGNNKLKATTTASEAGSVFSKNAIRPKDREGEASKRGALASQLAGINGATSMAASAGGVGTGSNGAGGSSSNVQTHIGEIKVYTQATDADGIAKDMGKSMDNLFASQANYGSF